MAQVPSAKVGSRSTLTDGPDTEESIRRRALEAGKAASAELTRCSETNKTASDKFMTLKNAGDKDTSLGRLSTLHREVAKMCTALGAATDSAYTAALGMKNDSDSREADANAAVLTLVRAWQSALEESLAAAKDLEVVLVADKDKIATTPRGGAAGGNGAASPAPADKPAGTVKPAARRPERTTNPPNGANANGNGTSTLQPPAVAPVRAQSPAAERAVSPPPTKTKPAVTTNGASPNAPRTNTPPPASKKPAPATNSSGKAPPVVAVKSAAAKDAAKVEAKAAPAAVPTEETSTASRENTPPTIVTTSAAPAGGAGAAAPSPNTPTSSSPGTSPAPGTPISTAAPSSDPLDGDPGAAGAGGVTVTKGVANKPLPAPPPGAKTGTAKRSGSAVQVMEAAPVLVYPLPEDVPNLTGKYHELVRMLCSPESLLLRALCESLSNQGDCESSAAGTARVLSVHGKLEPIFRNAIAQELEHTSAITTLFRGNTVATRLASAIVRLSGEAYLKRVLESHVNNLLNLTDSIELDPENLRDGEDAAKNYTRFRGILDGFLNSIIESLAYMPPHFRMIAKMMVVGAKDKFPDSARLVVGSFLFLRVLCPAITSPSRMGIPTPAGQQQDVFPLPIRKRLLAVTKALQNLANNAHYSEVKEPHLVKLNSFITDNQGRIEKLFDQMLEIGDDIAIIPLATAEEIVGGDLPMLDTMIENNMDSVHKSVSKKDKAFLTTLVTVMASLEAQRPTTGNGEMRIGLPYQVSHDAHIGREGQWSRAGKASPFEGPAMANVKL